MSFWVKWNNVIRIYMKHHMTVLSGNTKGGSITVPLTSCLTGMDLFVLHIKTRIASCHTADSKPVKHEVNGTLILPPFIPWVYNYPFGCSCSWALCHACMQSLSSQTFPCRPNGATHIHLSNIDCLCFVMCPLLAPLVIGFFSPAAI